CASVDTDTPSSNRRSRARVEFRFSINTAWSGRTFGSDTTFDGGSGSEIKDLRSGSSSIGHCQNLLVTALAEPKRGRFRPPFFYPALLRSACFADTRAP